MKRKRRVSFLAGILSICLCVSAFPVSQGQVKAADTAQESQYNRIRCHDTEVSFYMAANEEDSTKAEAAVRSDYGLDSTVWVEEDAGEKINGNRVVKLKNYATQTYIGVEDGEVCMMADDGTDAVKWEVEIKMDDEWYWTGAADFAWNRYKTLTSEEGMYLCTQHVPSEGGPLVLMHPDSDEWWSNEWKYEPVSEAELFTKPGTPATAGELANLKEKIEEARGKLEDEEQYRTRSLNTLKKSMANAEKVCAFEEVSAETVLLQMEALEKAQGSLEKVKDSKLYAPGEMAIAGQASIGNKGGYYLDFQEEFDGGILDSDKWLDEYLPHWTPNEEDSQARYEIRDGKLVLQVKEEDQPWSPQNDGNVICSGITTFNNNYIHNFTGSNTLYEHPDSTRTDNNYFDGYTTQYGYVEMRARMEDDGGGGHQALWMVGTQSDTNNWDDSKQTAEIDVLETSFYDAYKNWRLCGYGWNDNDFCYGWYTSDDEVPYGDPGKEYHTYGMEWTPTEIHFYYDGELYRTMDESPSYEMGFILSIYQNAGWSGGKPSADNWPKEFYVDYLRVYKPVGGYDDGYVDKTALSRVIEEARAEVGKTEVYTKESIGFLEKALKDANAVLRRESAGKEDVVKGVNAVRAALTGLEKTQEVPAPDKTPVTPVKTELPEKGSVHEYKGFKYKVTASTEKTKTVTLTKAVKKPGKTVTVPGTAKIKGLRYQVTRIADGAFKNSKKIQKVIIGANVKRIGKESFRNCKNLKNIVIKSANLKKVGKNACKGISAKAKIRIQGKKCTYYKKLFKNSKISSGIKIIKR